jgi:hypothetical protein
MPPTTTSAMRAAVRAAKADLTTAALAYHAAIENHLRAVRSETRFTPVYFNLDSDQAVDALARASERYTSAYRAALSIADAERRLTSALKIQEAAR